CPAREAARSSRLIYGTRVRPDGTTEHLDRDAFTVDVAGSWTSPTTGATYPAGWSLHLPGDKPAVHLNTSVAAQELDTRATTGVVYWEGSQRVTGRGGPGR